MWQKITLETRLRHSSFASSMPIALCIAGSSYRTSLSISWKTFISDGASRPDFTFTWHRSIVPLHWNDWVTHLCVCCFAVSPLSAWWPSSCPLSGFPLKALTGLHKLNESCPPCTPTVPYTLSAQPHSPCWDNHSFILLPCPHTISSIP